MNVLVTGGLGFQGSHLTRALLARGEQVTILSTPTALNYDRLSRLTRDLGAAAHQLRMVAGSVTEPEILEKVVPGHSHVVHMAASASVDASLDRPWPAVEVNVLGTFALLEAVRRFGAPHVRTVVASSCEVYGPIPPALAFQNEEAPMYPRSPYAASKIAGDRLAYAHALTYLMDLVILRPCNIYGPGQRAGALGAVIPTLARQALLGRPLHVTGTGEQTREFLHVEDLVRAYLAVLDGPTRHAGATYNVGSGEVYSILHLATLIRDWLAPEVPINLTGARIADVTGFRLDSVFFRGSYGWAPRIEFKAGLQAYCTWLKATMGDA
jgi:nucleoside-diphosphate-sugar epimerase